MTLTQKIFTEAIKPLAKAYMKIKPEASFQYLMHPLGYNNIWHDATGEDYFIDEVLSIIDPKLCLDIGANEGSYSKMLLESTGARIIAFEPLPMMVKSLEALRQSFPDRFQVEACGIGDKTDQLTINYCPDRSVHASFLSDAEAIDYIASTDQSTVPVTTLDEYLSNAELGDIDFIKIDVEGFEGKVLDGAVRTISTTPPKIIQLEYNLHQLLTGESIYSLSQRLPDYEVFQILPDRLVRRDPMSPEANVFAYSNFAFVRRDIVEIFGF